MRVKLFANFRDICGTKVIEVEPEGSRVRDLLGALSARHPAMREELFQPDGSLRPFVQILINGRNIAFARGLDTEVEEGDEIALFPPVAGG
ncbi:MAG: MoaD/ThiS family protein [Hydrogenibacillus sp.]|nr:MoaD/ThiS family protein [Hydrogenibacillus sp.]